MHAAADAEDARLLAARDHDRLLAKYLPVVQTIVYARVRGDGAEDVVQDVLLRLFRELAAGKTYPVPFRVVVPKVTVWLVKGHFRREPVQLVPLPDDWEVPGEDDLDLPDEEWLARVFADLPERQRQACELRYLRGLEIEQIAAELGMERNAVDQALHRAHARLRDRLSESADG
jgi:RNA polymerase sigma-70 factor (ECF subfamily)